MKNRFKRFLSITTVSATGTLIACIVWYGVYCLSGHREILHFWIPYMVLPEILSIGVLAGAVTELVLPPKDMEKWEGMLRLVVHYVLITLGVLVCGWLYGWYELSVVGVLAMCLTSAAVYFFTSALNYQIYKKTAEQMNEKLKDANYKMQTFDKDEPYLPLKKIGKNNPNEKFIKENNKQRLIWNKNVSVALGGGIPVEILKEVKHVEIIGPIKEAMRTPETAGMVVHIIARAIKTLIRFVSDLIRYNAVDKAVPGTEKFYEALDYSRAPMRIRNSKEKEWER